MKIYTAHLYKCYFDIDLKRALLDTLREFKDVLHGHTPRCQNLIAVSHASTQHREGTWPTKQASRNFKPELEVQIKQKLQKLWI